MKKLLTFAAVAVLPIVLSACCSNAKPRFWKVRAAKGGAIGYTVETVAVPANSLLPQDVKFVDGAGKLIEIANPKPVRELSEQEWKAATSGARYSLYYCGRRSACWAKAKPR